MPAQRASTPRVPRCCPLGAGPGGAAAAEGGACWRHRFGIRGWTVFFCVLGYRRIWQKAGVLLGSTRCGAPPNMMCCMLLMIRFHHPASPHCSFPIHDAHTCTHQISSPSIAALLFSPSTTHIHPACPTPTRTLRSATRSRCLSGLRLIPLNPTPCRPAPCPQMTVGRQSAPCKRVNEGPGGCIHQPTDRKRGGGDDK